MNVKTDLSFQKAVPKSFTNTSPLESMIKVVGIPEVAKNSSSVIILYNGSF